MNSLITADQIRRRLEGIDLRRLEGGASGQAAVLMAIRFRGGVPHFVLTRRTESVATHKGQISFPGGIREPIDGSLVETALRETEEEIGVAPGEVEILGEFHDYWAITDWLVRPVVGVVAPSGSYRAHPVEVAYILEVPLEHFATASPVVEYRVHRGERRAVYFFEYQGDTIWGLTAQIIRDFVKAMSGGDLGEVSAVPPDGRVGLMRSDGGVKVANEGGFDRDEG